MAVQRHQDYDAVIASPLGRLGVVTATDRLQAIEFVSHRQPLKGPRNTIAKSVCRQLERYFRNHAYRFTLPLKVAGTPFQQRVWRALQRIPAGEQQSYGQLARRLKTSARAVGGACRANPIPIVVPCHRVVSREGVGGYMGSTRGPRVQAKQWLLAHEAE